MTVSTEVRQALRTEAERLRGCLSHLKTITGRRRHPEREEPFEMQDPFVGDEDKLYASKTYRALALKTQVFTLPATHLVRSRLQHVMEVVGTTALASEMLGLNTSLARAAAIGHDVGHVPFGHQGESCMARMMGKKHFCHEVMGPIVTQRIERKGLGLNLTFETLEAMMRHSGNTAREGMSQEAWVLRHTDKITYLFHDYNDIVIRAKYPIPLELQALFEDFGHDQRARRTTAICALVVESHELGKVSFEHSEWAQKFNRLRMLMYSIYPKVTQQNVLATMEPTLEFLTQLGLGDPFLLLALLTDREVETIAGSPMKDMNLFNRLGISEIAPYLDTIGPVDLCNPDLDW
jgi:dGTPase